MGVHAKASRRDHEAIYEKNGKLSKYRYLRCGTKMMINVSDLTGFQP